MKHKVIKTLSHYGKNSIITKNELKYPCSSYSARIRDKRDTAKHKYSYLNLHSHTFCFI